MFIIKQINKFFLSNLSMMYIFGGQEHFTESNSHIFIRLVCILAMYITYTEYDTDSNLNIQQYVSFF